MTRPPRKPRQPSRQPGEPGEARPAATALSRRRATLALAAGWAMLAGACGGGEERNRRRSPVRLVNASTGYASLELRVDDQLLQAAVAYGERAAYVEADPDEPETTVFATGSPTALWRATPAYVRDSWFTVLAFGPAGALRALVLDDNLGEPDADRAWLRVVNAGADAGALDIYLTAEGETLDAAVPLQPSAAYGVVGAWQTVASGRWRLHVTAAGSKTDVRLDRLGVDLPSRAIRTLVLRSSEGGVLVDALLLAQRAGIENLANAEARVRLAALVTDSTAVGAVLGGVVLGSAVGSPALGEYQRVAAGTVPPAVTVGAAALVVPALALAAGRDHTLLVTGTPAAPRAVLLLDDNRQAADGSRARLRLVNALAEWPAEAPLLSMSLDFLPVAAAVAADGASEAVSVVPTTGLGDGRIAVTVAGAAAPLFVAVDQVLRAGGVYTVLVAGTLAAPVGIVRRDR